MFPSSHFSTGSRGDSLNCIVETCIKMDFPSNVFISKTEFEDINFLMHFIKEIQRKLAAQHWSFHIRAGVTGHQMMMCSLEQLI